MTIPYRLFNRFYERVLHGQDVSNSFNTSAKWTTENLNTAELGHVYGWDRWDAIFKGYEADGWITPAPAGLDEVMKIRVDSQILPPFYNVQPITDINFKIGAILLGDPKVWDPTTVTGRHYDGVNVWDNYPLQLGLGVDYWLAVSAMPASQTFWIPAWYQNQQCANPSGPYLWRTGCEVFAGDFAPNTGYWHGVDGVRLIFHPSLMKVSFWNSIVNVASRTTWGTAGGVPLVLTGLGFLNDQTEIEEGGWWKSTGWGDWNTYIYLIGMEGQGTYTLNDGLGHFTTDSNSQITIPNLPAMLPGHYYMKLDKINHGTGLSHIYSYAGDFRCDPDGRIFDGSRFIFFVSDDLPPDGGDDVIITSEWKWHSRTGDIFRHYAPIDTATPLVFFDGRILDFSPVSRALDDNSGMAQISDLDVTLSNTDQEFSKLLAEYTCYNQTVSFFWSFLSEPYAMRKFLCAMIVSDFGDPGSVFKVHLKDITQTYF